MNIPESAVKNGIQRLFLKHGVRSRLQLVLVNLKEIHESNPEPIARRA